eukprot:GHVN01053674.1.p1 GENE.GHVN01053674.1~~GHVN01053674.1.p1  ORF type:complete len:411 (+),score=55.89 GHVN01053674.1:107-1339(+)
METETPTLNITLVGRTGAGKSSLFNYLLKNQLPNLLKNQLPDQHGVTELPGLKLNITDTVGYTIEGGLRGCKAMGGSIEQVMQKLEKNPSMARVEKRCCGELTGPPHHPQFWCHNVVVVINAASNRVEELDKGLMKGLENANILYVVALTRAYGDVTAMKKVFKGIGLDEDSIFRVNSVSLDLPKAVDPAGQPVAVTIPTSGRDELMRGIRIKTWNSMRQQLPFYIIEKTCHSVDVWRDDTLSRLNSEWAQSWASKNVEEIVNKKIGQFQDTLPGVITKAIEEVQEYAVKLNKRVLNLEMAPTGNIDVCQSQEKVIAAIAAGAGVAGVFGGAGVLAEIGLIATGPVGWAAATALTVCATLCLVLQNIDKTVKANLEKGLNDAAKQMKEYMKKRVLQDLQREFGVHEVRGG